MENAPQSVAIPFKGRNAWLRNYLYYSTLIGVFSSVLILKLGLTIRWMYLALLLFPLVVNATRISPGILWFLLYLAASGAIGIARGTDSVSQVVIEFRAISVNVLYYYFFFKLIHNDFERAFLAYTRLAYWFAIIALPLWVGSCIAQHGYVRLAGLATEPAEFCSIVLPAYYWYAYRFATARKHLAEVIVFSLAVGLSVSSLGYLGVAFGIVLLLSGRRRTVLVAPVAALALLSIIYALSSNFRVRVNDTVVAATTEDLTGANFSTYSFISNALVTREVLRESPLIGNGLGSHPISHARFLSDIRGIEFFREMGFENANAPEGGSLTFRVLSEFGILGYLGVLVFLIHFHVGTKGPRAAVSNALLTCFFFKLIRNGNYYQPEQFFFIFIYMFNYRSSMREAARSPRASHRLPVTLLAHAQISPRHSS